MHRTISLSPASLLLFLLVMFAALVVAGPAARQAATAGPVLAHPPYEPDEPTWDGLENLFAGAKVSESGHWHDREARLAVDGRHNDPGEHWGADGLPVNLTVDLTRPRELNTIRLWTYWNGQRAYQYLIEGSTDGTAWITLVDRRGNRRSATAEGETFAFPTATVRYVRTTITGNSQANNGHIVEIAGHCLPSARAAEMAASEKGWRAVAPGLHGAIGSKDVRYRRGDVPKTDGQASWSGVAWRGERVALQAVVWTGDGAAQVRLASSPLRNPEGKEIAAGCVQVRFVRYVLASPSAGDASPPTLEADVLDTIDRLDLRPRTARPIWISIDVPADSAAGKYQGEVSVSAAGGRVLKFALELEVLPLVLPPPSQWSFRLDLWQDPWSVAWYHGVEPWSDAHWKVLGPHLRMLADAGQKFITTYITCDPWGESTYIENGTMVEWVRRADGTLRFDYAAFDRYVEFAQQCGITQAITCYTPIPWGHRIRFLDEASGDYVWAAYAPGTAEYDATWTAFLADFAEHLRKRGWFEKTYIGINENPPKDGQHCMNLVHKVAPGLKVTWAGLYYEELKDQIDDWCFIINPPVRREIIADRAQRGRTTTFYVCCGPERPNTFTFSPPAEAAWLGWYAAAEGYDGLLRWAYDSWVRDPLADTRYVRWPAGDCFLVYPGPRSSIRFERLREGIADYEKIRAVRQLLGRRQDALATDGLRRLDEVLARFTYDAVQTTPAAAVLGDAQRALVDAARVAAGQGP